VPKFLRLATVAIEYAARIGVGPRTTCIAISMKLTRTKQLGTGGFGTVDLVTDDSGNEYARKTFSLHQPLGSTHEQNVRKRFIREAKKSTELGAQEHCSGIGS
jgi:serine/threonine protein kinase